MPGLDGIEATRRIAARPELSSVHVIILTTFELDEYVFEGLRAGAAGFLVKDTDAAELIRAVRVVARGEALLSPTITRRLIAEFAARTRQARSLPGLDELTPREREVVALIASGLSNDEISRQIYVSASTAKTHAARAMTKLGAQGPGTARGLRLPGRAGPARLGGLTSAWTRSGHENGAGRPGQNAAEKDPVTWMQIRNEPLAEPFSVNRPELQNKTGPIPAMT